MKPTPPPSRLIKEWSCETNPIPQPSPMRKGIGNLSMLNQIGLYIAVICIFLVPAFTFNTPKPVQPVKQVAQAPRVIPVHHKQLGGINTVIFKQCILLTEYVECK